MYILYILTILFRWAGRCYARLLTVICQNCKGCVTGGRLYQSETDAVLMCRRTAFVPFAPDGVAVLPFAHGMGGQQPMDGRWGAR